MLNFDYHPAKAAVFLEPAALPYAFIPNDTCRGEPFAPESLAINPNARTPALVDGDGTAFDTNATRSRGVS
jgi:GST-like protein